MRSLPLPPESRRIYAIDVGSTLKDKAFAWAATHPDSEEVWGGRRIEPLVENMAADLSQGISVALGLEAPLFLPIPKNACDLSKGRTGDEDRSCFAPAGGYVAALALHQGAWILKELRKSCGSLCSFTLDPARWYPPQEGPPVLFCWEAFVSKKAHAERDHKEGHIADAATAARFFAVKEKALNMDKVKVKEQDATLSLIGTAALWSGWSTDLALLETPTVVLRPEAPWGGHPVLLQDA